MSFVQNREKYFGFRKLTITGFYKEKNPQERVIMNCTPFVRQYGILDNKWGDLLCRKEYQTRDTRQNSSNW